MTARHVLTFAQSPGRGGVERAQLRLCAGWAQAGRRVTLVLGRADDGFRPPTGVHIVELGSTDLLELRRLASVVRALAPDLIFCPGNHYTGMAALLRLRLRDACPPIVAKMSSTTSRGDHGPVLDRLHAAWLRTHGRFLDRLVCMTPATARAADRALGMGGRVHVIANPPTRPDPDAPPVLLLPGRVVLGVGRLVGQKRWDRLVDALPRLPDDVRLVLLGEGPERSTLEARARSLRVAHRVHLPGHAPCPLPAMARAALVALPSDFEGAPGVLREALSVGTPVVATDVSSAIREIVADGSQGDVVPRGDAEALLAALNRRLRPDAPRPTPVPQPGEDAVKRYLQLFDGLVAARLAPNRHPGLVPGSIALRVLTSGGTRRVMDPGTSPG
ncbi:glycosyltransferase [Sphingomonas lenta]|uniref:Glycosyltransferase n=1 Tax=Sphingomonas lenta TaxID=1141887 RepID=A0A2A2SCJ2_9SPHN|nr:glycosyltransferase [Sphingomonas lenta]PAX06910.1 glycosyltransferase [Sphingomonas lenta]